MLCFAFISFIKKLKLANVESSLHSQVSEYIFFGRVNRHTRHFSLWRSLIKVWRYMVKSTTMALRKIECACWKNDNTGFVSHLTEEAWLTVSSFGCFSNFHTHYLIIPLWFSNFKNNTLFLIYKQCHMASLKFKIQNFQYFWIRQLAYQQLYVGSGLQNIIMSLLVMGTDKENITLSNKISGNWNICFWLDHDTKHLENCTSNWHNPTRGLCPLVGLYQLLVQTIF